MQDRREYFSSRVSQNVTSKHVVINYLGIFDSIPTPSSVFVPEISILISIALIESVF